MWWCTHPAKLIQQALSVQWHRDIIAIYGSVAGYVDAELRRIFVPRLYKHFVNDAPMLVHLHRRLGRGQSELF